MADKDLGDGDGPSLEMPSLGSLFKRKKKPVEKDDAPTVTREELDAVVRGEKPGSRDEAPVAESTPDPDPAPAPDDTQVAPAAASEEAAKTSEPEPGAEPARVAEPGVDNEPTAVVPVVDSEPDAEPTTVIPPTPESTSTKAEPTKAEPTTTPPPEDAATQDAPAQDAPTQDEGRPLFADEVDEADQVDEPTVTDTPPPEAADAETDEAPDESGEDEDKEPAARSLPSFTLPLLPSRAAAAVTGLVVGVLAVAMTYLAVQGCEKVKGTSSCGSPGFFLLIAIMILLVVLGSSLLNAWQVDDPGSTSFLGVGLMAVIALLFLIKVIYSPWMGLVIPVVTVATFVVSHWLTSLFIEEETAA